MADAVTATTPRIDEAAKVAKQAHDSHQDARLFKDEVSKHEIAHSQATGTSATDTKTRKSKPLTPEQLAEVEKSYASGDIAKTWELLASYGDTYATAAAQGIKDPTSFYGHAIRNSWQATNADLSKFNDVAKQHQRNYINIIQKNLDKEGVASLPTSTQIETSYYKAVTYYGISPYSAVDLLFSKMTAENGTPNWHDKLLGAGINLEDDRKGPPSEEAKGLDYTEARNRLARISTLNGETLFEWGQMKIRSEAPGWFVNSGDAIAGKTSGASPIISRTVGGFTVYHNTDTHTMGMLDKRGYGHAWIDGKWQDINPGNWRTDPTATEAEKLQGNRFDSETDKLVPDYGEVYQFKDPVTNEWKRASLSNGNAFSVGSLDGAIMSTHATWGYFRLG